jgi:hypothetical protein
VGTSIGFNADIQNPNAFPLLGANHDTKMACRFIVERHPIDDLDFVAAAKVETPPTSRFVARPNWVIVFEDHAYRSWLRTRQQSCLKMTIFDVDTDTPFEWSKVFVQSHVLYRGGARVRDPGGQGDNGKGYSNGHVLGLLIDRLQDHGKVVAGVIS